MSIATRCVRISLVLPPLLLLAGCQRAPADPAGATTPTVATAPVTTTRKAAATGRELVRRSPPPVRIEIPAIGVSSALVRLGLNTDGTMQVPGDYGVAGWFTGGPAPGDTGPAVIAGHVDSRSGPAIFYRLGALRPGDAIKIIRADGRPRALSPTTSPASRSRRSPPRPCSAPHPIRCSGSSPAAAGSTERAEATSTT
jgi:Sortase domain